MTEGIMKGKRGLVMGVANDHSIAWGIAKTLAAHGADLAFTYQGEALAKRVRPLASSVNSDKVLSCDVEDLASVDSVFDSLAKSMGQHRLPRPRHRVLRQERAEGPLRRHHPREFSAHHADLVLLLHRDRQARRRADARWRLDGDADLWRLHARHAQLQRHGRGQGGAGGVGALSRRRFRSAGHPRQRHLGRTGSHARGRRHRRRAHDVQLPAAPRAAAPHGVDRRGRRRRRSICCPICPPASPATFISSIPATTSSRCRSPTRSRRWTRPKSPPRKPPPRGRRAVAHDQNQHK